jgi:hypothetical protein
MTMTLLTQLGVIPALLVVLAGMLVLHVGSEHTAGRRFLFFTLAVGLLLAVAVYVSALLPSGRGNQPAFLVSNLLAPPLIGVLALILLHLKLLPELKRGEKALVVVLGAGIAALLVSTWWQPYGRAVVILPGALLLAAVWAIAGRSEALVLALSVVALVLRVFLNALSFVEPGVRPPPWLRLPFAIALYVSPGLAVVLAAVWISASLELLFRTEDASGPAAAPVPWRPVAWRLGLAALLLGTLAYTILWSSIWDQATDGLGGIMFAVYTGPIAIAAGMLIAFKATRWHRWAGLAFAVLVPLLVFGMFRLGWDISYHAITEARATRIQRAVERFHARHSRYPQELGELVPRDLLWISRPIILQGRGWCYQGGQDDYWLAAAHREYFGTPLSLRIYASSGSPPASGWACEEELAELKERHDPPPMYEHDAGPTREPLPTSVVSIPRTPVQPLAIARHIFFGTWSARGKYFFFGALNAAGKAPSMTLHFVNAKNGDVCLADESVPPVSSLRRRHAWLPDGRLLFLSEEGEMYLLTPCAVGRERLTDRYPARFDQVAAYDGPSGRILLENEGSFWILDGASLEALQIREVSPNPDHRDNYAWSPGGERLAISRLNGRDKKAESTLYLVAGETGEVVRGLPLEYATDQHAPGVEWLTEDELLLHGPPVVMDLRTDPPAITHVLEDILALDVVFPYELSTWASIVDPGGKDYYLAVRVNHPRNQNIYLYRSETGGVDILRHEISAILIFPGGDGVEMRKLEDPPATQDEYDLVWVDASQDSRRLVVQGHTPRDYPDLDVEYLPRSSQIALGRRHAHVRASPNGEGLVAMADEVGVYWIPLPQ